MSKESDFFKVAFFGSSEYVLPLLDNIFASQGGLIGEISKGQYNESFDSKKSYLEITPNFWNDSDEVMSLFDSNLLEKKIKLQFVVTSPTRELRGKQIPNPVAEFSQKNNMKLFQPQSLKKDVGELINELRDVDLAIVASYGLIIPESLLELPKYGMINWHPSKLPEYRGPSPVQSSIMNGDKISALSWIEVEKKMDAGNIYYQEEMEIGGGDNFDSVMKKMIIVGSRTWAMVSSAKFLETVNETADKLITTFAPKRQDYSKLTFCKMVKKEDKFIDPQIHEADYIYNHFRAFIGYPGSMMKSKFFGENIKLIKIGDVLDDNDFHDLSKKSNMLDKKDDIYIIKIGSSQRVFQICKSGYLELIAVKNSQGKSIDFSGYNFR